MSPGGVTLASHRVLGDDSLQPGFTAHGSTARESAEHRFFGLVINLSYRDGITTGTNPNLWPRFAPSRWVEAFFRDPIDG